MTKRKRLNNDLQNATQETRLSNMNLTKTRSELMCFFRVSSSCSTSGTHRGTLVTNHVKNHEWRTWLSLRQTKHIRGHLWQIFTTSVKMSVVYGDGQISICGGSCGGSDHCAWPEVTLWKCETDRLNLTFW